MYGKYKNVKVAASAKSQYAIGFGSVKELIWYGSAPCSILSPEYRILTGGIHCNKRMPVRILRYSSMEESDIVVDEHWYAMAGGGLDI